MKNSTIAMGQWNLDDAQPPLDDDQSTLHVCKIAKTTQTSQKTTARHQNESLTQRLQHARGVALHLRGEMESNAVRFLKQAQHHHRQL